MKKIILGLLIVCVSLIALTACGQKGNLYLPEPLPKTSPGITK